MKRGIIDEDSWQALLRGQQQPRSGAGLPLYAPIATAPRDGSFIVGQVGQSLDGRIATSAGDARDVSGQEALKHLHRLRALCDAVIVGVGTVLHDDPRLTVRHVTGPNPARVVIDPSGRVPSEATVFAENRARRIVIQTGDTPRPPGVEVIRIERRGECIPPQQIVDALAARGLHRLLVEGGARTIGRFVTAGLLHRLHISVAPLIIGDGPAGLTLPPVPLLRNCLRPEIQVYDLGGEFIFDCALDPDCFSRPAAAWAESQTDPDDR